MDKQAANYRLKQAIEYLRDRGQARNQKDMAFLMGMRQPHIAAAINGDEKRLTEGFLRKFADAYSDYINEEWLLTGEGRMEVPDKDMRPHYPASVEAGVLGGESPSVMDYEVEMEPLIKRFPSYDFTIDVSGHSMEPTYYDGDIVACRNVYSVDELTPGKVYVIATRDGAVLKRYLSHTRSTMRVASDNPDYKSYNIDLDSIFSMARVVGSISNSPKAAEDLEKNMIKYLQSIYATKYKHLSDKEKEDMVKKILSK